MSTSSLLSGAGLRVGCPSAEGGDRGSHFQPELWLANVSQSELLASVNLDVTSGGVARQLQVAAVRVQADEVVHVGIQEVLSRAGMTHCGAAGIEITWAGAPGSIIGDLISRHPSGTDVFQTPLKRSDRGRNALERQSSLAS